MVVVGARLSFCAHSESGRVLCANGNTIEVRDLHSKDLNVRQIARPFDFTIITGIVRTGDGFVCFGDRELAVLGEELEVRRKFKFESWITAVESLEGDQIAVLTAHNTLQFVSTASFSIEKTIQMENVGVLLSGIIRGTRKEKLVVIVGTVFGVIKIFRPNESTAASATCNGHGGMIFGLSVKDGLLASISDDRSLRIWSLEDERPLATAFGHSGRPFAIAVSKFGILTAGGDQTVCIWSFDEQKKTLELRHQIAFTGGPIRSLFVDPNGLLLVGTDTGTDRKLQLSAHQFKGATCCLSTWIGGFCFVSTSDLRCHVLEWTAGGFLTRGAFEIERKNLVNAGCFHDNLVFLGTTSGSIYVLDRRSFELVHKHARFHSRAIVTDIAEIDGRLHSIGKDGNLKTWTFSKGAGAIVLHSSQPTGVEWPAQFVFDSNGRLEFIAGFHADKFVLVNARSFLVQFAVQCGGGHRIWSFSPADRLFEFVNKGHFVRCRANLAAIKPLEGPFHASESTCLDVRKDGAKWTAVTGGNDTKITTYDYSPTSDKLEVRSQTADSVSSLHDLVLFGDHLLTLGGRGEFFLWRVDENGTIDPVEERILDEEARILSVAVRPLDSRFLVAVVTSLAKILLFDFDPHEKNRMECRASIEHAGISSYTKVIFADDQQLIATTTDGFLHSFRLEERTILETAKHLVEQNNLSALNGMEGLLAAGSTSGHLHFTPFRNEQFGEGLFAARSRIDDVQSTRRDGRPLFVSVSLDRCAALSTFDSELQKASDLLLCLIAGYGLETVRL
ncbi:hypothetical protein M3Y99_00093100 [Aphelenchoides fujianensis]|nr:hypothetical protein M3Y99_00093100 [Aphelenchoides fujianensis]